MEILITGGCGYVGTSLAQTLALDGHRVRVFDTQWFGNHHPTSDIRLEVIKGDVRSLEDLALGEVEVIIHLANIANDPGADLNPILSWEVNVLAGLRLIEAAISSGVRHFIYASSASVYGISNEPKVTENTDLVPLTTYNKTKMIAEKIFLGHADKMAIHCVRPATVCGWSPRMRLDLTVNLLTLQALTKSKITVFGGSQHRPNIHISDMIRVYQHFLENPDLPSGAYNAGFENLSVIDIARKVSARIPAEIIVSDSTDPRSYRVNSDKLLSTGFQPKYSVDDAIEELIEKYNLGKLVETKQSYTVGWMKELGLDKLS